MVFNLENSETVCFSARQYHITSLIIQCSILLITILICIQLVIYTRYNPSMITKHTETKQF